jgi:L-lactate dehydrogenase complex protein LldG
MTSAARSAIFASIRENLAASSRFDAGHGETDSISPTSPTTLHGDVLDRFRDGLNIVGATLALVENENEAAARLREIIGKLSATRIVISNSGLVRRLAEIAGIEVIEDASRDQLFSSDVGITGAQWAIAETGTLVLEGAVERHRLVSLVPPVHVCLLHASSIRQSMAEILELLDTAANPAITFITGASRTSDIELTLAIGVHGPRELFVIVIKDQ